MASVVIFDFDGTLVDSNTIKRQGFFDVVAGHVDGTARMARVLDQVQGDRWAIFAAYLADASSVRRQLPFGVRTLVQAYSDRVDAMVADAREMPGATHLLHQLRSHQRRTYLSSATPIDSLRRIVEQREWPHLFDGVFGHPASKRESIARIQRDCTMGSASIAVVGDGIDDRDSAASIGCAFYPVGDMKGLSDRERVFTLHELVEVLLGRAETFS